MSGRPPQNKWKGVTELQAREIRQEICQCRHRISYAKMNSDTDPEGRIGGVQEMTCAIIARMLTYPALRDVPRNQLAKAITIHNTRMKPFLVHRHWPNQRLIPHEVFGRVVRWLLTGDVKPKREGSARFAKNVAVADAIEHYFFPASYRGTTLPYFRLERRLLSTAFDYHEMADMVRWIWRQALLQRDLGRRPRALIVLMVNSDDLAKRALGEIECISELALAAVQDAELTVRVVIPADGRHSSSKDLDGSSMLDYAHWEWIRQLGTEVEKQIAQRQGPGRRNIEVLRTAEHRVVQFLTNIHPMLYLTFSEHEYDQTRGLLFLRPLDGSRAAIPLTFHATDSELKYFEDQVRGHGIIEVPADDSVETGIERAMAGGHIEGGN
jgi:hypothetical protein